MNLNEMLGNSAVNKWDKLGLVSMGAVIAAEGGVAILYGITAASIYRNLCNSTSVGEQWYFQAVDIFGNPAVIRPLLDIVWYDIHNLKTYDTVKIFVYKWKDIEGCIHCIIDLVIVDGRFGEGNLRPGPPYKLRDLVDPPIA